MPKLPDADVALEPNQIARIRTAVEALRPHIVETLQRLVQIPSETGHEGLAQEAVAEMMQAAGCDVDVWEPDRTALLPFAESVTLPESFAGRPNVVGVARGEGGGRSLILNGHIDTVEVGDRTQWSADPLSGQVIEGRLYGRGACDMKGGIIANLFALQAVRASGFRILGDVILESTISEEDGGSGALAAVLRGYVADAVLISEPTEMTIVIAQGGSLMFRLRIAGRSAHACMRGEGVSAFEKFALVQEGLLAFEALRSQEIDHPQYQTMAIKAPINLGTIKGGAWHSTVPESVVIEGRAGLVPGETLEAFKIRFATVVQEIAAADPWLAENPPIVEWLDGQFAPADIDENHPFSSCLRRAIVQTGAVTPLQTGVTYGADMRHFVHTGGMPCVMFGAGDVRLAHAPDESIRLDDLFNAIITTAVLIAQWNGTVQ